MAGVDDGVFHALVISKRNTGGPGTKSSFLMATIIHTMSASSRYLVVMYCSNNLEYDR